MAVVGALLAPGPLAADTIWQDPGPDDWFDATNWDNGIPNAAEDTFVNNGGTAVGASGGPAATNTLSIGVRNNGIVAPPSGTGSVEMDDVNLNISGDLLIGRVEILLPGPSNGANGSLATTAGAAADGDVTVGGEMAVGYFVAGPSSGSAVGNAGIAGDLTGDGTGVLIVGQTEDGGDADGTLDVDGDVGGFTGVTVGATETGSAGEATGDMTVGGALSASGSGALLAVGTTLGAGSATGTLEVGDGLEDFRFVLIGTSNLGTTNLADGSLTIQSGGAVNSIAGFSNLSIALANGDTSSVGTADITGNVEGYEVFEVAATSGFNSVGNATGDATVVGNIVGNGPGDLRVGLVRSDGDADGTLNVSGDVSGFAAITVGATESGSTGEVTGAMTVGGALSASGSGALLAVGTTLGAGSATGTLEVGDGLEDFRFVLIGTSNLGTTNLADGSLTIQSGGAVNSIAGFSNLSIALANGDTSSVGTADITGNVEGYEVFEVAATSGFNSVGNATGDATVVGNIVGNGPGDLRVGLVRSDGDADGTLNVSGDVSGFAAITVGATESGSTGEATGAMTVGGALSASGSGALLAVGTTLGAGSATGTLEVGDGLEDFRFVLIGTSNLGTTNLADGSLTIQSGGAVNSIAGFSNLSIALANGDTSSVGTADITGNVEGYQVFEVAATSGFNSGGNATGDATVVGNIVGNGLGDLRVGFARSDGDADGTLNVTGSISGFPNIFVGHTIADSTGSGIGQLSVTSGTVMTTNMMVGVSDGTGGASGTAAFEKALVSVSDTLTLDDGSTLRLTMDGIQWGIDFAAVDATKAILDGALEVAFTFQPAAMMSFDLIVSGAADGIMGDFAMVDIMGLLPGTMVTAGIVTDTIGNGLVEIYRLTIGDMVVSAPEPGTLWLFGFALLGMVLVVRRPAVS